MPLMICDMQAGNDAADFTRNLWQLWTLYLCAVSRETFASLHEAALQNVGQHGSANHKSSLFTDEDLGSVPSSTF